MASSARSGEASSSGWPRRLSISSPGMSEMRMKRAFGKHRRRAVADLVVELAADQQHDVRLGHGSGAHRAAAAG